jgi:hypothetical protein
LTLVVVDHAGISKTASKLGGEGTNILALKSASDYSRDHLDAALPADEGVSPANGGWFAGPGGWMLLVEGSSEAIDSWVEQVALSLADHGIEGTLTGAGVSVPPKWARQDFQMRSYHALFGFRQKRGARLTDAWLAPERALDWAVSAVVRWLTELESQVLVFANLQANIWATGSASSAIMRSDLLRIRMASAATFNRSRGEIRKVRLSNGAALDLGQASDDVPWQETVDTLRAALISAPLTELSIAMVTHRSWGELFNQGLEEDDPFHGQAYARHPERWDELTLDPCGIQILTNGHLATASDLSNWRTTRLDDSHHLVEARDLAPWFSNPPGRRGSLDPELINDARTAFGKTLLTPALAAELGLDATADSTKPLP